MGMIIVEDKKDIKKRRLMGLIDWLVYMVGYAVVLVIIATLFKKSFQIDSSYFGLYYLLAAVLIYALNKTVKPILFFLTLPITGLTMGLFYPVLNIFVLKMVELLLGSKFVLHGTFILFVIAILISVLNILMEGFIIKPILERLKENE